MPDPIRGEEVNIQLTWTADARTGGGDQTAGEPDGIDTPADFLTQMIAATLTSNDEDVVITQDGRLVRKIHAHDSGGVPQDV